MVHPSQVVRQVDVAVVAVIAVIAVIALAGCSGASDADARAATAAQLETHLDTAWLPADAELAEARADPPTCATDCPPVAISYTYRCACDDLDGEMATIQELVEASGFEIVEPYASTTGRFVGRHPDDEIDRGDAWVVVRATGDDGSAVPTTITVTLSAERPAAG